MSLRSHPSAPALHPGARLFTIAALASLALAACGQSAPSKEHGAAAATSGRADEQPTDRPRTPGPVASGSTGIAECDLFLAKMAACSPGETEAIAHLRETYRDAHAAGVDAQMVPACRQGLEKAAEACSAAPPTPSAPSAPPR